MTSLLYLNIFFSWDSSIWMWHMLIWILDIALIENNAVVGAKIAAELSKLDNPDGSVRLSGNITYSETKKRENKAVSCFRSDVAIRLW